jgi:hypothetical protein
MVVYIWLSATCVLYLGSHWRYISGYHNNMVNRNGVSVSHMTTNMFRFRTHNTARSSFMTYHRVCKKSNSIGAISGAGTSSTYPFGIFWLFLHKAYTIIYHPIGHSKLIIHELSNHIEFQLIYSDQIHSNLNSSTRPLVINMR